MLQELLSLLTLELLCLGVLIASPMIIHPNLALRGVTTEIAFLNWFYFFETAARPGIGIDFMALSIPPKRPVFWTGAKFVALKIGFCFCSLNDAIVTVGEWRISRALCWVRCTLNQEILGAKNFGLFSLAWRMFFSRSGFCPDHSNVF